MQEQETLGSIGEFALIDRLRKIIGETSSNGILLGPGDDAAVIQIDDSRALVATNDTMIEGRHFLLDNRDPHLLGRRLASINLSDLAAMGAEPKWALINLSAPPDTKVEFIDQLYRGLTQRLSEFGAVLAGGNTAQAEKLSLDLFLVGEVHPDHFLRRDQAQPGDGLYVTGTLGCSEAGRLLLQNPDLITTEYEQLLTHHLDPTPRIETGRALTQSGFRVAALDISDGLTSDLAHLTTEQGQIGAVVELEKLPLRNYLKQAGIVLDISPADLALSGGEDFELLFTLPPEVTEKEIEMLQRKARVHFTRIGTLDDSGKLKYRTADGSHYHPSSGWDHFAH